MPGPTETSGGSERDERPTGEEKAAWKRVLEEMRNLAAERRQAGWSVVEIQAGDTVPEPPEAGDSDRFGVVFVVPGNVGEELVETLEDAEIDEFDVHRRVEGGTLFFLMELRDADRRVTVMSVGAYELAAAEALAQHATRVGYVFTHFRKLDGTHLASFRHEDYEKLLPGAS